MIKDANAKIKYWLRWVLVLPGAVLAGLLVTIPLHLVINYVFGHQGNFLDFMDFPLGLNTAIENLLYSFIIAITFISVGYKIAPKYKVKTASVLFVVYIIAWSVVGYIALSKFNPVQFSARTALAFLGAIIGLYIAKRQGHEKKELAQNIIDSQE